jgi:NAD(P)-dependent dehydrogenase (short-subunit alcohol dehydrogenase family)
MAGKLFSESVVWITGASAGIGRALAQKFAEHGARVAVSARRADRLAEAIREVEAKGAEAMAVPCDVRDEASLRAAVDGIVARFGRLDVAVANAGIGVSGKIRDLSAEDWRRQLETNVIGVALTARFSLPELERTRGRLAIVASVAGFLPGPGTGAYAASKYAVRSIGQTLSIECHRAGVSCTTIHPGFVVSDIALVDADGNVEPGREDPRPKKLMWPTDRAADVMLRAIYKRKREYVFTGHGKVGAFLGQHMPGLVHAAMVRAGARRALPRPSEA